MIAKDILPGDMLFMYITGDASVRKALVIGTTNVYEHFDRCDKRTYAVVDLLLLVFSDDSAWFARIPCHAECSVESMGYVVVKPQ